MPKDPRGSDRVEALFDDARRHAPGPEREAFLAGACGQDAELRQRVEALLAAHDQASGFLESPAMEGTREAPGATIGPYKLLQEIGEGGMGVVYMAEQESPVRRKVALKVIKLGMDTKQVIARFEAERQALALMDHPHIARVLDAGTTETGRPYFVMELVRGVPIDAYCDTHKLSTDERLQLFVEVCRAVQHAHQKGVIHRDLKPTNVLITSHDGKPVPKIIDFGVAKATNQRLTERTLFTEFQQIIGTPEYMSPEQAEMSGLDVDTRSDIYSLGVLMYQLLTGTTPVDPTELRVAGFEEMTRMIREDDPPSPSTRVSKLGESGERFAAQRASDASSLSRRIRGELDWIVMRALEKDRTRRYETAAAFADDVTRHLEDQPVEAGPVSASYRLSKFARRNRRAVAAALVFLAVLGLGLAGTTAGFLRALAEGERSRAIGASLEAVLALVSSPAGGSRETIEATLRDARESFGEDHATYAAVLDVLSARLHATGDFAAAEELGRESVLVWTELLGAEHPNAAVAQARLGRVLRAQGKEEEAEAAYRAALAVLDGAAGSPSLASVDARTELASLLALHGEYEEAEELHAQNLALLRESPSPRQFHILAALEELVAVQLNMPAGDARETMRQFYEEAHAFYPETSPNLAVSALGYGRHLFQHGQLEESEPYLREAIGRLRQQENPSRVLLLSATDALFQITRNRTDTESVLETDAILRDLIEVARPFWSPLELAGTQAHYASRLMDRGRFEDAFAALLETHRHLVELGDTHAERERLRDNLTVLAFNVAARPELDPGLVESARQGAELAVADEPDHPAMLAALGAVQLRQGQPDLAVQTFAKAPYLSDARGGLARSMAPVDHAFRALAHGHTGDLETARAELELLLEGLGNSQAATPRALVAEIEALLADPPSPSSPSEEG